jgi:hypothetical protein
MSDRFDPSAGDAAARTPLARRPDDGLPSAEDSAMAEGDPLPWEADPPPEDGPLPWDLDPAPDDPDAHRQRHDAFTEARKSVYLRALVKTGAILDACRLTKISPRTVYRHQEGDPDFFENCRLAIRMSATPVEITAWQRAVEGVEQEFAVGGEVRVRRRYADGLLRLLLQGSNPRKYGARPGFKRKHLLKHERKQIEREVRAEHAERLRGRPVEEVTESIIRKVEAIERHREPARLAAGWTKSEDGHWVPPGYAWVGLPESDEPPAEPGSGAGDAEMGEDTPRDSM